MYLWEKSGFNKPCKEQIFQILVQANNKIVTKNPTSISRVWWATPELFYKGKESCDHCIVKLVCELLPVRLFLTWLLTKDNLYNQPALFRGQCKVCWVAG